MAGYTKNSDGGYSVNYEDERFQNVKAEQTQQKSQMTNRYDSMISNSDKYYQDQIDATKNYEKTQTELQQAQTDFVVQQIEQQKEQARDDYAKEQKGAYVDYMKQKKSSGVEALNLGMSSTGYSESSIVSIYNQYQNRVGMAKESFDKVIMNYNDSISQAMLANNEKLAEIANNTLEKQAQYNQQAFEYKNTLMLQKEQQLQELNNIYYARYQDVENQINNEIQLQMTLDQIDREYEQWEKEFNAQKEARRIQHEQWEREFAAEESRFQQELALSKQQAQASIAASNAQAAYHRAQADALKGETSPYGNPYDSLSGLSSNAKNLYNQYKNALTASQKGAPIAKSYKNALTDKATLRKYIVQQYENKNISENDADILFANLGL